MGRRLFSNSWHSVAELRPLLVPQARMTRHVYRGQVWFVVQDQSGGRFHRLSPAAHELLMRMDGTRTVQSLWEAANVSGNGEICTQDEIVDLLVQLHAADLLQADTTPDSAALLERKRKKRRQTIKQWLLNPMSIKIPLLDPDPFLARWASRLAWIFSRTGLLIWLAAVLPALVLAAQHWNALTTNMSDRVLSSSNLLVMAIVFPFVKIAHELGHGFATRVWGGAVHEMGVMLLVFAPVPYVDASASASFASKYQRAAVAAAGMMVELFIAALAMFVWVFAEPGVVRAVAFNVMLIAGVSTVVVNGNPLLRYDGYYILADLIEMPNLAQRGQKYLTWWWNRKVFGVHDEEAPPESPGERRWLVWYTPLAWLYRVSVTVSIILFVGGSYFIFGTLLALWGGVFAGGHAALEGVEACHVQPGLAAPPAACRPGCRRDCGGCAGAGLSVADAVADTGRGGDLAARSIAALCRWWRLLRTLAGRARDAGGEGHALVRAERRPIGHRTGGGGSESRRGGGALSRRAVRKPGQGRRCVTATGTGAGGAAPDR
ncbi:hypothetical protein [Azospira restricta]|uniref:hypothetical protein n=1 Tax=Azospira restricta TaxID=404405 RepID=UPI001EEFA773|nr:hypothetical protein [Azospira restricta]